ncbi:tetratricopeptide repeat protein [Bacteroidota bacterium]
MKQAFFIPHSSGKLSLFISAAYVCVLLIWLISCNDSTTKTDQATISSADTMQYVGREACKSCHEPEYALYEGSDHDKAMARADSATVLGDFNDAVFTHLGVTSKFYTRDGNYYVFSEGPDGEMAEFKVDYVFGVRPLQQYLVPFPGGRYQCLPLCWDSRPKKEGGQRWFHIYGDEKIPHTDFLYWTRIMQNWNYMCAECHSTNLKKSFDPKTDTYHTTWSEIDVSCEACHGPGSEHVAWAEEAARYPASQEPGTMGLAIQFKDPEGGTWVFKPGSKVAERTVKRDGRKTLETCARCHARRSTIHEDYTFGKSFLDTHRPSLLEDILYYPDGQIQDEVYVYASFLQSKMYHKGVICSDCHDPHSLKVYVQGNALCYRCHMPDVYGVQSHHHHKENSTGALCVECHMPERTYMQVDPRRDHSMRNPRPDLSERLGTPNACSSCHARLDKLDKLDKLDLSNPSNLSNWYFKWYGKKDRGVHYGETFWKARRNYPEALPELIKLATDTSLPAMVRSSSFYYLTNYQDASIYNAIASGLKDPDPLIRFGAFEGSTNLTEEQKTSLYRSLLYDPTRLIRTQAARNMPQGTVAQFKGKEKNLYDNVLAEYMEIEMTNADHPFSWMNLANYWLGKGDLDKAEKDYRRAIQIEPYLPMSYINLADLFRRIQMDTKGKEVLEEAMKYNPGSADVHHSLGLLLIREKRTEEALGHLKQAAELNPANSRYSYVYGVGLYSTGNYQDAISFLEQARKVHPFDREILFALVSYYGELGQLDMAKPIAEELVKYYPADPTYQEVLRRLNSLRVVKP